jgi:hypothetical protein
MSPVLYFQNKESRLINIMLATVLSADDQVIISDTEDRLQKAGPLLEELSKTYNFKVSTKSPKQWPLKVNME